MITSLVLEWHNWTEHYVDDLSKSRTIIYKNSRRIIYTEFDGRDNILLKQEGKVHKDRLERFFFKLDEVNANMTKISNYSVDVCDGSCWEIKIRHSKNNVQKLKGTIEYPLYGKHIEREILRLCEEANISSPCLTNCVTPLIKTV